MRQTLLSIVLIVAIIGAGYFTYQFFAGGPSDEELSAPSGIDEQKLEDYRKIETLKPDLSVFTDSFFKSLFSPFQVFGTGATTTITAKPGRPNPFMPF